MTESEGKRERMPMFPVPTSVSGRLRAVGAVALLVALLLAVWPVQSGTRDCGNAFAAEEDSFSDYTDGLRISAGLPIEASDCDELRGDAQARALMAGAVGVAGLLGGWVVAGRRPEE